MLRFLSSCAVLLGVMAMSAGVRADGSIEATNEMIWPASLGPRSHALVGAWTFSGENFEQRRDEAAEFLLGRLAQEGLTAEELEYLEELARPRIERLKELFPLTVYFRQDHTFVARGDEGRSRVRGQWVSFGNDIALVVGNGLFAGSLITHRTLVLEPLVLNLRSELDAIEEHFSIELTRAGAESD